MTTSTLASFVAETSLTEIPDEAQQKAKEAIQDLLGVTLYGSRHAVGSQVGGYVQREAAGDAATVIGGGRASTSGAALANGAFGHAIDYDDTFESIVLHPSAPVFGAALAAAEQAEATGAELLAGYLLGTEVAFRVGHSTYPAHYENGWHSTGTAGSFGAAAAAGATMGLAAEPLARAFGIVGSSSSALKKNFGTMTKPLHAGHAAEMGVRAALLAAEGFTADPEILEGPIGYGAVMTPDDSYDPAALTEGLGSEWAVMDIGYKPYPSGVITHAAMDALREVLVAEALAPADIARVEVALDDAAAEMLHHARPATGLEAKFSIEFCLAAVIRERDPGVHEFTDEYVTAPATRAEIEKVERAFEPNLFGGQFANYAARVTVETTAGETYTNEMTDAPGHPSNPLSSARLTSKFETTAGAVLDEAALDTVQTAIAELETAGSLAALLDALDG
jgi:2-methylcitrate dehydratase PrpD